MRARYLQREIQSLVIPAGARIVASFHNAFREQVKRRPHVIQPSQQRENLMIGKDGPRPGLAPKRQQAAFAMLTPPDLSGKG